MEQKPFHFKILFSCKKARAEAKKVYTYDINYKFMFTIILILIEQGKEGGRGERGKNML